MARSVGWRRRLDDNGVAPAPDVILANPYITGKLLSPPRGDVLVRKARSAASGTGMAAGNELPVPPNLYWEGYGPSAEAYLASGREHTETMLSILRAAGADPEGFERVLDWGCAAGRMLRWFPRGDRSERWGCDIKGETIAWCQQNLSPPMDFAATTTLPHLPFEDHYFDLVYCGSVFTHIIDLPDMWFLELRRILRPGGYGYVTVFDKHALQLVLEPTDRVAAAPTWFAEQMRAFDGRTDAFTTDFAYFSTDDGPRWEGMPVPQVCYDIDFLVSRWSRLVEVVSVTEEAYAYQTAVLFRR